MKHLLLLIVFAAVANGCTNGGNCDPSQTSPPDGSPSEFTTLPGTYDGYRVDASLPCTSQRTVVRLTGLGAATFWDPSMPCADPAGLDAGVPDACGPTLTGLLSDVADQLRNNGALFAKVQGTGNVIRCDDPAIQPPMYYLHIDRWQDADPAVSLLGQGLNARSLGEAATIIVEPQIVYCPL